MDNVIALSYRSTFSYLIDCQGGKLLVDAGWPGTMPIFKAGLKRYQIEPAQIKYVLATHMHPDHAGLAQEVKTLCGSRLIIHRKQAPFLGALQAMFEKKGGYVPIQIEKSDIVIDSPGRATLESIGIKGALIETPGHSDDSLSLVLDSGTTFVGDLTWPDRVDEQKIEVVTASWRALIAAGARVIYPGHGGPTPVAVIARQLPGAGSDSVR